jgi:hypothetical protein
MCYKLIMNKERIMPSHKHGGPYDRGSADAYYGRKFEPHYYPSGTGFGKRVTQEEMTEEEIREYAQGYREEPDRKSWE